MNSCDRHLIVSEDSPILIAMALERQAGAVNHSGTIPSVPGRKRSLLELKKPVMPSSCAAASIACLGLKSDGSVRGIEAHNLQDLQILRGCWMSPELTQQQSEL